MSRLFILPQRCLPGLRPQRGDLSTVSTLEAAMEAAIDGTSALSPFLQDQTFALSFV